MRPGRAIQSLLKSAGLHVSRLPQDDPSLYADYDRAALEHRRFLNVGAGSFEHPYWTNLDLGSSWYAGHQTAAFVEYDLGALKPLPFDDQTIELVYSSHTIEHVRDHAASNLFREAWRVLKPGGGIRITCPDAELMLRTVAHQRMSWWRWREDWFRGPLSTTKGMSGLTPLDCLVREVATPRSRCYVHARDPLDPEEVRYWYESLTPEAFLDRLVEGIEFDDRYPGDHINWWTEDKLLGLLGEAGFLDTYSSGPGQSLFPPLTDTRRFDCTRPNMSLFVEAIR